ncbi:MAG: T9SS type A sorting domain-containing protein [Flavobacteriales bacterium]|nr:T9SS type A sorting domain-containing protein [Flavobacteriales bacterium]MBK6944535.1 T9SS type A sorting domain-containing protein [Flavobacteriales bacterium]MBK7241314.1 T9SS type A sorting domain-containing protein [Flavobacteriales bacterium]MBK9534191.1 T9SS type A sorting domain-containing protein [Flavobacteriales bacterium]MBP9139237.1 T9SS type A sorting domain-containing protein [Flavobacteriales bacterium]
MKNFYQTIAAMALAALMSANSVAQTNATLTSVAQKAGYALKKHSNGIAAPVDLSRGGSANDECADAIVITVGPSCVPVAGTATGAGESLAPNTCSTYTSPSANDVWFSFVATGTVSVISVTGGGDDVGGYDPIIEGYSGACASLVSINCIDATLRGEEEMLTLNTVIGTTYYYRVYNWDYGAAQTILDFTTCVYTPTGVPANDQCTGAVVQNLSIGGSVTFNGDNTGALDTEGFGIPQVWEAFTITDCAFLTLDYCGTTPAFENLFINLSVGCPGIDAIINTGYENTSCVDGNYTVQYQYVPAGTYYYPVLMDATATGPYTINVSAVACPAGFCDASADSCDEYIAQVICGTIDNTTLCTDGPAVDYTAQSTDVPQGSSLAITVLNGPNVYADDQVAVWVDWNQNENFADAGEAFILVSADASVTFTGTIDAPVDAVLGSTRMRIRMMWQGTPSPCGTSGYGEVEDYSVNVVGPIAAPVNDLCSSVTAQALNAGGSLTFTGTTAGATNTNDFEAGSDLEGLNPTVWHAFTTTECTNVTISYCDTDPAFEGVWIFLSPGCPAGNDYLLASTTDFTTCVSGNATMEYIALEAGTYYLPVQYDAVAANGPYSINVSAVACAPGYCVAGATTCDEYIAQVTFGMINNTSGCSDGPVVDYTAQSTTITQGSTVSMTVLNGPAFYPEDQVAVWVDWNQDEDFTDVGEAYALASADGAVSFTGDIMAPLNATLGSTRMRIRMLYTGNPSPCGNAAYGEVEDYTVNVDLSTGLSVIQDIAWSVFPNPSNGDITITYGGESDKVIIDVLDLTGRMIHSDVRALSSGQQVHLNLAGVLATGSYVLRLSGAQGVAEQRFVVR